jgi:hypothetical protein
MHSKAIHIANASMNGEERKGVGLEGAKMKTTSGKNVET